VTKRARTYTPLRRQKATSCNCSPAHGATRRLPSPPRKPPTSPTLETRRCTTTPPTVKTVIGEPKNINAASITALRTGLDALEAEIAAARAELDAVAADMAG